MADIRRPNVTSPTPEGQLQQIKTYLYQLTDQLNFALKDAERIEEEKKQSSLALKKNATETTNESDKAQETFGAIKNLIIKSADVVDAFYDEISKRLEGHYSALANDGQDYASFVEDTMQWQTEGPESNTNLFEATQKITKYLGFDGDSKPLPDTDSGEVIQELRKDTFFMKTGWLYEEADGTKIGGIELGQVSSDSGGTDTAFARFTPTRLVFYGEDGKTELGTFEKYRLTIKDATIKGNLELGDYVIDTDDGGLAFLWGGDLE